MDTTNMSVKTFEELNGGINMKDKNINVDKTSVVTGKIILHHAHLFEKWSYEDYGVSKNPDKGLYSAVLVIPKTDDETLKKINIGIKKAAKIGKLYYQDEDFADSEKFRSPLKDGDAYYVEDIMYKNNYYMTATSKYKPEVITKLKKPASPYMIQNGIWARASILFNPYCGKTKGVSCVLNNVQIFEDEIYSPSRSRAVDDFD